MRSRSPSAPSSDEIKVCGLNAVLALAERRRDDIVRVYVVEALKHELGPLLKWCAAERKAYHIVDEDELERVADSVHHEGVCVLARQRRLPSLDDLVEELERSRGPACLFVLENVRNPHNLGAILRTSAHFGVRAVIVNHADDEPLLTPALYRTAEGGAEFVDLVRAADPSDALDRLGAAGFQILATSSHVRRSIYELDLPPRVVFLLGAEGEGLTRGAISLADELVAIPGTGAVESLNVGVAAAVLASEHFRSTHVRETPHPTATKPRGRGGPRRSPRQRD